MGTSAHQCMGMYGARATGARGGWELLDWCCIAESQEVLMLLLL